MALIEVMGPLKSVLEVLTKVMGLVENKIVQRSVVVPVMGMAPLMCVRMVLMYTMN